MEGLYEGSELGGYFEGPNDGSIDSDQNQPEETNDHPAGTCRLTRLSEFLGGSINFAFILLILLMGARCGHKNLLANWHLFQRPHEICLETEKNLLASVNSISLHEDSFYFLRFTRKKQKYVELGTVMIAFLTLIYATGMDLTTAIVHYKGLWTSIETGA